MLIPTSFILSVFLFVKVDNARILAIFPMPSISHQLVFRSLVNELVKRHEVTVLTPDPQHKKGKSPTNLTEINVHDLSYGIWRNKFVKPATVRVNDLYQNLDNAFDLIIEVIIMQALHNETKNMLRNKTFDLILVEAAFRPALLYSHFYRAPVIAISSFGGFHGDYELFGAPNHPLLYPLSFRYRIRNLTKWEKIKEVYRFYKYSYEHNKRQEKENIILKRYFGEDFPSISKLSENVQLMFLNVHPLWDGNRPVPPNIVYMGGIHQKLIEKLPEYWQSYLDSSKEGVIYVSFGTNTLPSVLPSDKIQTMVRVFSQLPYDILWKWDTDVLLGRSDNIKIAKWLPQPDLLDHKNIKLFITHGGLQSTDEAIAAGVPLVGIPMRGDQWYNTEKYELFKIGIKVEFKTLDDQVLKEAIETVINNTSYRSNIAKLCSLMHDQPQRPLERAVWWTEHVLRHGGAAHLAAPAANITWGAYLELDLVLICLTVILSILILLLYFSVCLFRIVSKRICEKMVNKIKSQ